VLKSVLYYSHFTIPNNKQDKRFFKEIRPQIISYFKYHYFRVFVSAFYRTKAQERSTTWTKVNLLQL